MLRVPFDDLDNALNRAMLRLGFAPDRARLCARLFAETTRDGVYTHGLNRFPRFEAMVRNGVIEMNAEPALVKAAGALERWDGRHGPGNLNAYAAMSRAMELAGQNGIGAVALGSTNHWMRGGTYGWMAADAGMFALCWSNTLPNVPAWGAKTPSIGNNPLVIACPRAAGPVVIDMAMSQFSYGTIEAYAKRGEPLPVPGGYDRGGTLTTDAAAIEASQRALPIGYWKGSGLAVVLDLMGAVLSGGNATHQFSLDPLKETGQSQMFIVVDPASLGSTQELDRIANGVIDSLSRAEPVDPTRPVRYPGEQTLRLREENLRLGVPVDPKTWESLGSAS